MLVFQSRWCSSEVQLLVELCEYGEAELQYEYTSARPYSSVSKVLAHQGNKAC